MSQLPEFIQTLYGEKPWITTYTVNRFARDAVLLGPTKAMGSLLFHFRFPIFVLILCLAVIIIGLIYFCLRCAGRCSPVKDYCESKCQRGCRIILSIVMIIVIILIIYCLIPIIYSSLTLAQDQGKNDSKSLLERLPRDLSKLKQIKDPALRKITKPESDSQTNAIIDSILESVKYGVKENFNTTCAGLFNLNKILREFKRFQDEIDELCYELLTWSDLVRTNQRNITLFASQTKPGRELLKSLNFGAKDVGSIAIYSFLKLTRVAAMINQTLFEIHNRHKYVNEVVKTVNSNIKNVVLPYEEKLPMDLRMKGDDFETVKNVRSRIKRRVLDFGKKPRWVIVFEWICIIWIILICIILLIALLCQCCGTSHKDHNESSYKSKYSLLFQIAIFMLIVCFLLALIPFLWNFLRNAMFLNGSCKLLKKVLQTKETVLDGLKSVGRGLLKGVKKVIETVKAVGSAVPIPGLTVATDAIGAVTSLIPDFRGIGRYSPFNETLKSALPEEELDKLTESVQSLMPPKADKTKAKIKKYAKHYKDQYLDMDIPNLTSIILEHGNETYLDNVYNILTTFADKEMTNDTQMKQLTICNLNSLRDTRIDIFSDGIIQNRNNRIIDYLTRVKKFLNEEFDGVLNECLDELENLENYYRDKNNNRAIIGLVIIALKRAKTADVDNRSILSGLINAGKDSVTNVIKNQAKEIVGKVKEHVKVGVGQVTEHVKEKVGQAKEHVKEKVGQVKEHVKEKVGQVKEHVTEKVGQVKKKVDHVKKQLKKVKTEIEKCEDYSLLLAFIWTWLFLLLLLLLPLIPIAIYLSRIYICDDSGIYDQSTMYGTRYHCEEIRAKALPTCNQPCDRTRRLLLRVKFIFQPVQQEVEDCEIL